MSQTNLPRLPEGARPGVQFQLSPKALDLWNPSIKAAAQESDNSISIFDVIGSDYWTGEGVSAKRIAAALRSIGPDNDVTVNVNSPGGDMFEGIAIYNLLREHRGRVTVKVLGIAASAASVIAMAADRIEIGRPAFFMIHNAWVVAAGNRHELREISEWMEPFDAAMADVYGARTGIDRAEAAQMMDKETWIGGAQAVESGFADALLAADEIEEGGQRANAAAVRRLESAVRASGLSRAEAQRLISEFKASLSDSASRGPSDSADNPAQALRAAINLFKGE